MTKLWNNTLYCLFYQRRLQPLYFRVSFGYFRPHVCINICQAPKNSHNNNNNNTTTTKKNKIKHLFLYTKMQLFSHGSHACKLKHKLTELGMNLNTMDFKGTETHLQTWIPSLGLWWEMHVQFHDLSRSNYIWERYNCVHFSIFGFINTSFYWCMWNTFTRLRTSVMRMQ